MSTQIPIGIGCLVKIKREPLDPNDYTECFWLEVMDFVDSENLLCRVDNDLHGKHAFKYGDVIPVKKSEIYSCLPPLCEIERGKL